MTHRVRGKALMELLLVTGGLGTALGCSCDFTEVRQLSESQYQALLDTHGPEPDEGVCASLCDTEPSAPPMATGDSRDSATGTLPTTTPTTYSYDDTVTTGCRLVRIDWTTPGVRCEQTRLNCAIGRRPAGLGPLRPHDATLGAHFARIAQLEAASVVAFRRLAAELSAHGAPRRLVDEALASAADEARHADQVATLARRYGVDPEAAAVAPTPRRSLEQLAVDNAVEGCVGEALGAMLAAHAAATATDPTVAATIGQIAADEARHAALSFAIGDWLRPRLTPSAQRAVAREMARALAAQQQVGPGPLSARDRRRAGVAPRSQVRRWLQALGPVVWGDAAAA